jgi:hypothetical protein
MKVIASLILLMTVVTSFRTKRSHRILLKTIQRRQLNSSESNSNSEEDVCKVYGLSTYVNQGSIFTQFEKSHEKNPNFNSCAQTIDSCYAAFGNKETCDAAFQSCSLAVCDNLKQKKACQQKVAKNLKCLANVFPPTPPPNPKKCFIIRAEAPFGVNVGSTFCLQSGSGEYCLASDQGSLIYSLDDTKCLKLEFSNYATGANFVDKLRIAGTSDCLNPNSAVTELEVSTSCQDFSFVYENTNGNAFYVIQTGSSTLLNKRFGPSYTPVLAAGTDCNLQRHIFIEVPC